MFISSGQAAGNVLFFSLSIIKDYPSICKMYLFPRPTLFVHLPKTPIQIPICRTDCPLGNGTLWVPENGLPRVFDPRNDKLFDTVSGYFSAESLENRVIARPVRKLVVAIRSPQCGALHWPQANHKLTDKSEFVSLYQQRGADATGVQKNC